MFLSRSRRRVVYYVSERVFENRSGPRERHERWPGRGRVSTGCWVDDGMLRHEKTTTFG